MEPNEIVKKLTTGVLPGNKDTKVYVEDIEIKDSTVQDCIMLSNKGHYSLLLIDFIDHLNKILDDNRKKNIYLFYNKKMILSYYYSYRSNAITFKL